MKTNTSSLLLAVSLVIAPFALSANKDDTSTITDHQLPVYQVQELSIPPELVYSPIPSTHNHLAGSTLEFRFRINAKGRVVGARLKKQTSKSTPNEMVWDYARQFQVALYKWRFNPARDANNQPVAVSVRMPIQIVHKETNPKAIVAAMRLIVEKQGRS